MRLNHAQQCLPEDISRGSCGIRLHEYGGQVRAVLLGEYTSELQDPAASVRPSTKTTISRAQR